MSDSDRRFDTSRRSCGAPSASGEPERARGELETLLALTEDRAVEPEQRPVAGRLQADPACRRALERQREVVRALRGGGPFVPPGLSARYSAGQAAARPHRRQRAFKRPPLRTSLVGVAAAVAALVVVVLLLGSPQSQPNAAQVAAIWTRSASVPVAADPADPRQLDISFHGIVYPNYHDREGWHPLAARYDRIGGLRTATVLYATGARRAAYTVVPTTRLSVPVTATHLRAAGLSLTEFRSRDRWIVTFVKGGNTCVLTAAAPRERRWLIKLAIWNGGPAVTHA